MLKGGFIKMPEKKRTEADMERRRISDRSFKIWDKKGKLIAEMSEGKWIKKPKGLE